MSNVTECIDLYAGDPVVTDAQFRAIIIDAHARDQVEHESKVTYWHAFREARRERRQLLEREGA